MAEIISSGTVDISSGVTSTGLLVLQDGILQVLNKGWAVRTEIGDGGKAVVSSGGTMLICTVSAGGTATVLKDGYAQTVTVESGGLYLVSSSGKAFKSFIQSGGTQVVFYDVRAISASVMDGGILHVSNLGCADVPTVSAGGIVHIWSGGLATKAQTYGRIEVHSGGMTNSAAVLDSGKVEIQSSGYAYQTAVSSGGTLETLSGGSVNYTSVYNGGKVEVSAGASCYNTMLSGGTLTLESEKLPGNQPGETEQEPIPGGYANNTTVNSGGTLIVSSGATAESITENGGYVKVLDGANVAFVKNTVSRLALSDASATIHSGTTATDTTVNAGGKLEVFSGGTANGVTVNPGGMAEVSSGVISGAVVKADGSLLIYDGTSITGHMTFEDGAIVIPFVGSILDFDLTQTEAGAEALVNDLSILMGTPSYTLTVSDAQAYGTYALADGAAKFDRTITVQNTSGETLGTLGIGTMFNVGETAYLLNLNDSSLTFATGSLRIENPVGTKDLVSWDPTIGGGYVVEYSTDGFQHCLRVAADTNAEDLLELPDGTWQWRVRSAAFEEWSPGNEIVVSDTPETPKVVQSDADANGDVFFATPNGTWGSICFAQHVGSVNDWTGTNELVSTNGKGRIQNLFFGSADPNVLCLSDGENGDALFVDDVFTDLPEGIEGHMSRLYKIQEIRAGAGDDIVDMTSQRFEYTGDGLTIRGGDGDDTIWANKGDNFLFGDAGNDRIVGASGNDVIAGGIGNDRMHGGGGNDVFTFCENWGVDNVEQLTGGSLTLWFASGSEANWDPETLTYMDGDNSVKVSGITADKITLKFGDDGSDQFATLSGMGAFFDATSERIFEESGRGILVSV